MATRPGSDSQLASEWEAIYGHRMSPQSALSLSTPRVTIRLLDIEDLASFVEYRQDPRVARHQGWDPSFTVDDGRALIAAQPLEGLPAPGGWVQLGVHSADGSLVGDVAVHTLEDAPESFEVGVTLAAFAQGSGLGTEAVTAVISYLFESVGAHRVVAHCDSRNGSVARLLERVGMRKESSQLDADWFKGEWATLDGYAILANEWVERKSRAP